ncbi:hypothetical protein NMG60_11026707 [Bertholletia excelsa]
MEDFSQINHHEEAQVKEEDRDPESNSRHEPLIGRDRMLSSIPLATVGTKVSHIESLDYEIIENDLFKQEWRSRSKIQKLQYIFLKWVMAFLIGLLTGIIATFISFASENIAGYKLLKVISYVKEEMYIIGFVLYAGINFILTMVAALLCVFFAPTAAGPGVPEIKAYLNGVNTPNMFEATTLIVKVIGNIAAVSANLDLGREGPMVHIGTCIGSLIGQGRHIKWGWFRHFNNDRDHRDVITIGASSGVCAAFRAPVGGVLFALEEVATWWRSALLWRTFFSTAVVVMVLRTFMEYCRSGNCGLFGQGGQIMFDVSDVTVRYHAMDIIPVVVIGVVGGVLGSLYNYCLQKILRLYGLINEKGKLYKLLLSSTVSFFTSACLYGLPLLASCTPCDTSLSESDCPASGRMSNFMQFNCPNGHYNELATILLTTNEDAVRNIFSIKTPTEYHISSLIIFLGLYCFLGVFTFGIAVPTGLFLPILLMGSAYGRILGIIMGSYTKIDHGLYAVLGAASLMAGSMRMTVSICVIFLELTNNLLLLPITMLVLLIAKSVGDYFNQSIYEIILDLKGLPFLDVHPVSWMRIITTGELADAKPPVIMFNIVEKVAHIVNILKNTSHNGFPVIDEGSKLHGLILRAHLVLALKRKWIQQEKRRREEQEAQEEFTWADMAEKEGKIEEVPLTENEMEMYIDLHPLTNRTPYTVAESMSVAKALVLFREVGLRHMLITPEYQAAGVSPVVGILTRQDLMPQNILRTFPRLEMYKERKG